MSAIPVTLISMIKDTEFKIKIFPILTWYCIGSLTFMEAHILLVVWTGGPREREKVMRNVQEMFKKRYTMASPGRQEYFAGDSANDTQFVCSLVPTLFSDNH
jgi:hypothetical protein